MSETFEQMALRKWQEVCNSLSVGAPVAIKYAAAIRDELENGAEPAAHLSEIWDGMIERRQSSPSVENRVADLSARLDITTQRDELLAALKLYEQAFDGLFSHCLSNGVFNAWDAPLDCTELNIAHESARAAIASVKGGAA